jgi:hypothetical protein
MHNKYSFRTKTHLLHTSGYLRREEHAYALDNQGSILSMAVIFFLATMSKIALESTHSIYTPEVKLTTHLHSVQGLGMDEALNTANIHAFTGNLACFYISCYKTVECM